MCHQDTTTPRSEKKNSVLLPLKRRGQRLGTLDSIWNIGKKDRQASDTHTIDVRCATRVANTNANAANVIAITTDNPSGIQCPIAFGPSMYKPSRSAATA